MLNLLLLLVSVALAKVAGKDLLIKVLTLFVFLPGVIHASYVTVE